MRTRTRRANTAAPAEKIRLWYLLRDVALILLDCGLRPEECQRLRWEHYRGDTIYVPHGKTVNARREIPLTERAREELERRRGGESPCFRLRLRAGIWSNPR